MERVLEAEWLDVLPPSDARAKRARADLRRINFLMGNARHIARALAQAGTGSLPEFRLVDLGAGDGSLVQRLAARFPGMTATLVDRAPAVDAPRLGTVLAEDAHAFLARPGAPYDAIVANLFLHHFARVPLAELLALAARRTRLFVACEPRRSRLALQASRLLGLLGCNDVTRHDAVASVRAGFRGDELSRLWPRETGWRLFEGAAAPFSHLFIARRDAPL